MSIYAEVTLHPESSKVAGIDYLTVDMFAFLHRIVSGDCFTDYPGIAKGMVCDDLYVIEGMTISPEGAPTNWEHSFLVDDHSRSILKGYRKDDVARTGFPTVGYHAEKIVADNTTTSPAYLLGGADDFSGGVLLNKNEKSIRWSGAKYTSAMFTSYENIKLHVWADDSMVFTWTSLIDAPSKIGGSQLFMIGEPLHDFQNKENFSLGYILNLEGSGGVDKYHPDYYTFASNVENASIATGERAVTTSLSIYSVDVFGYGGGTLNQTPIAENFPILDGDSNLISQQPVLTTGGSVNYGYWFWAAIPQNNIIYHPGQTHANKIGTIVDIGGKRFVAHGISRSGCYEFYNSDGQAETYTSTMWLYLPLDN